VAYQIFTADGLSVELNTGYEGNEFSSTGNIGEDVLNISAVHPMRKDAVEDLIIKSSSSWEEINYLVESGELLMSEFEGNMRNLKEWRKQNNKN